MKGVDAKHYAQKWIEKKLKEIENRESRITWTEFL